MVLFREIQSYFVLLSNMFFSLRFMAQQFPSGNFFGASIAIENILLSQKAFPGAPCYLSYCFFVNIHKDISNGVPLVNQMDKMTEEASLH